MSWIAGKGQKGLREEADSAAKSFGPRRFWLKAHSKTKLVFLDDDPLRFYEHTVKQGEDYHQATCTGNADCPLCAVGNSPYYAGAWTVLDRSEYTGKDGKVYKDQIRLFIAKQRVMSLLARKSERMRSSGKTAGLAGVIFEVSRGDKKSASTGDEFEAVSLASETLMSGKTPLKYEEILAPDMAKLRRLAAVAKSAGSSDERADRSYARSTSSASADDGDEIPF